MATAALITTALAIASPLATTFLANDNTACWTDDARAKMLLASCASHPPAGEWSKAFHAYGEGEAFRYTGYRAEALSAIRDAYGQRALDAYHAHGEAAYPQFDAWCRSISVNDAIDAAAADVYAVKMEG
ncbi:hypothetical protein [Sphingomonas beigongshangi]|uniref:hypothetical protein n=1 Tax=Sphingomonas beigongshangi TaxID=2782540 RepID=UPI00193BAE64|nr:hypothetical protein [Sphingomonas beigongshangi]